MPREPLRLRTTLTASDVRVGLARTLLGQTRLARLFPIWMMLTAGMVGFGLFRAARGAELPVPLLAFGAVLALVIVGSLLVVSRIGDRMFRGLRDPRSEWVFDAEGIRLESGRDRLSLAWGDITFDLRESHLIVHPTVTAFHVLPLRGVRQDDLASMRAFLESHGRPVPRPKHPWRLPLIALGLGVLTALLLRHLLR